MNKQISVHQALLFNSKDDEKLTITQLFGVPGEAQRPTAIAFDWLPHNATGTIHRC